MTYVAMIGENDLEFEMVNHFEQEEEEDDDSIISASNKTNTTSPKISSTQLIDSFIQDVTNKKEILVTKMDSVMKLMRQVEYEEQAAQKAIYEADRSSFDVLVKMDELKQAKRYAEETNDKLVSKVSVQKAVLSTKMEVLQLRVAHLLDEEDRSLDILDEMHKVLQMRLPSAIMKKELANKKKQENEAVSLVAVAYQEIEMKKMVYEINRLKQELEDNSKLQDALIDYGNVLDMLSGQISHKCHEVSVMKDELVQTTLQGEKLSCQKSPNSVFQSSDEFSDIVDDTKEVTVREISNANQHCKHVLSKGIKKVNVNNKLRKIQIIRKSRSLKIKGLQVVNRKCAIDDHEEDNYDDVEVDNGEGGGGSEAQRIAHGLDGRRFEVILGPNWA